MRRVPTMVISRTLRGSSQLLADGGEAAFAESEREIGDILDAGGDVGVALAVHRDGQFFHDMEDDRDIVRGEVPGDVDVLLEQAEVQRRELM
jgi:hypothetical protein